MKLGGIDVSSTDKLIDGIKPNGSPRKRGRGRPTGQSKQEVADRLLAAAELLMREQGHIKATERRIAAAAGVSASMIYYYFNNKDGLLFSVTDHLIAHVA